MERHVSSVRMEEDEGEGSIVDKIKGGSYSRAQYAKLTQDEKDRVAEYRKVAEEKKRKRKRAKTTREEETASEGQQEEAASESQVGTS